MRMTQFVDRAPIERVEILGKDTIVVGYGLVRTLLEEIITQIPSSTYILVTDTNLARLHLQSFIDAFEEIVKNVVTPPRLIHHAVPPGESSKSSKTKEYIENWMFSNRCTRDSVLLALGGGVIGDMAGFVAATFMRGIKYVQIPTTLLSMVDSSIGGKTAIDVSYGKNLIGAFWQPQRIFVDLAFLETLPEREFINGMAEIIKTAAFWDETEFNRLETNVDEFLSAFRNRDPRTGIVNLSSIQTMLHKLVIGSIKVKAFVVSADEREGGLRNLLNFGHSVGHAYEAIFAPQVLHGECVAIGMVKEAELARYLGLLSDSAVARIINILSAYGLPISPQDKKIMQLTNNRPTPVNKLLATMAVDKKNSGAQKKIVLLTAIGKTFEQKASVVGDENIRLVLSPDAIVRPTSLTSSSHVQITPPGSKSITNRALLLAALSSTPTRLSNLLRSDDTEHMMNAIAQLSGADFTWVRGSDRTEEDVLEVKGRGGNLIASSVPIYLGNSGTSSRFLAAVTTLVKPCTTNNVHHVILTGNDRMKERPIGPLVEALNNNGADVEYIESNGSLPLRIAAGKHLKGGRVELAATISSQYVSALLMTAPYAEKPTTLALVGGRPISQSYIDMTIAMMVSFGVQVVRSSLEPHTYHIPNTPYKAPSEYVVESDASSATYPLAFAALTGTSCTIPNIGSTSLQGDAKFAIDVLRPMGCLVVQNECSTTVTGPPIGGLKSLKMIDMEPMTDAFLTASVLAAVAHDDDKSITQIVGIANQRVKECDRIAAMITELGKFGVHASELPDGIAITGVDSVEDLISPNESTQGIYTYDDHRIAMSFSLLGTVARDGVLIKDRKCVEKTWPGWWDVLHGKLGTDLAGYESPFAKPSSKLAFRKNNGHSLFVIGMRGAGKTSVGGWIAEALKMEFTDLDVYLETKHNRTIPEIIRDDHWDGFRKLELEVLQEVMTKYPVGHVFACGGGIVETPEARELLKQFIAKSGIVIHIHRDVKLIMEYLSVDKTRPSYVDDMYAVWQRREAWFDECSNFFIYSSNLSNEKDKIHFKRTLLSVLNTMTGVSTVHDKIISKARSYFLALTFPDVQVAMPEIETMIDGADALELRVDLLQPAPYDSSPSIAYVQEQIGLIRKYTDIPIIFTVRTVTQGGRFPDTDYDKALALMLLALKLGISYLDVELSWPSWMIQKIVSARRFTKLIASNHDWTGTWQWDGPEWEAKYNEATCGREVWADVVKFVGFAKSRSDNIKLEQFRVQHGEGSNKLPFLGINMGKVGQLSRVLNRMLTPVTHPLMPIAAAPGQLSVKEIQDAATLIGED
ncbi:EPSP synthase-domain-containing protein [Lipomyces oligophaga]|uniref:EPSP synthase-domain-containing protein n=1 Tax=Lipomyces oligophaga TaxID=45792 RepID=UPI0034CDE0BD